MVYGSWFNVRLMNCEIFIFIFSLVEGVHYLQPSLLDC